MVAVYTYDKRHADKVTWRTTKTEEGSVSLGGYYRYEDTSWNL